MSIAAGQEADTSKKKVRRGSRHVEAVAPSHYGPVVCTSAAAALVQACLATDTSAAQQSHGGGNNVAKGSSSASSKSAQRTTSDSRCFLNMSESTLDPVKRRFGGKSKPVLAAAGAENLPAASVSSGPGSRSKGSRLSFGQGTKIVATKEAMHAALHCRCVFVLLRELCESSCAGNSINGGSAVQNKSERVDTAHLITLSPDDLFFALSVDSFPLTAVSNQAGATRAGGGSGSSRRWQHQQTPVAAGTLPRAFDVVDGPAIIHRPAARQGEPWRGLEIFRPDGFAGLWKGQRIPVPVGGSRRGGEAGDNGGGIFGDGNGGNRSGTALRLDLAAASANKDSTGATPTRGQGSAAAAAAARSKKRAGGCNGLVVCPSGASPWAAGRDVATGAADGRGGKLGGEGPGGHDQPEVAVLALPACVVPAAGGETEGAPTPPASPLQWASLALDGEGGPSLSPWRGLPFESKNSLACLCRAAGGDTGMVSLAPGGGGLVLRSTPPTVYVGMAGIEANGCAGAGRSKGVLLELQGGTLSGSRLLPAPPSAVMPAAVDDAHGVLVVLLADLAGTAMLLARDGSDFPVVEQHRGVTAAFTGDFLGNGREQVAFLCAPPAGGVGGGGRAGKRGILAWEQAPLKALVKRALVTDGSFVWENQRREGPRAAPSGGGVGVDGNGGADTGAPEAGAAGVGASPGANNRPSKGKKRQRSGELDDEDNVKGDGNSGIRPAAAGVKPSTSKNRDGQDDGHRLDRLSSVVGVLRRRVVAEEARLLGLLQARRGKAAALEGAKLAIAAHVGSDGVGFDAERESGAQDAGGNRRGAAGTPVRAFTDGLVAPGGDVSTVPKVDGAEKRPAEAPRPPLPPLHCTVARVRFHAPSRALCLDAHIANPLPDAMGNVASPAARPSATVLSVCLTGSSASGSLTTRSAVCPRLCPGESATIRACVDVPFGLLASGGGAGGGGKGAASLFASCTWTLGEEIAPAGQARDSNARSGVPATCSLMFARILVSPQDMLGIGGALTSTALAPADETGREPSRSSITAAAGDRTSDAGSTTSNGAGGTENHLGIFDVGTPLDLLLRSDPSTTAAASLAALPQAVRSLSEVAALPEPWAGGAAVRVGSCSERAAECTVRVGDAASAPAVILACAAGALPDGAQATADHASEQGRALVAAAAAALGDEMAALEAVARARGLLGEGAGAEPEKHLGVGGGHREQGLEALEAALERYGAAQMRSDVLAARLAGRVVAAGARGGALGRLV
eukprot:g11002.t1